MAGAVAAGVISLLTIAAMGVALTLRAPALASRLAPVGRLRVAAAADACVDALGRLACAAIVVLGGGGLMLVTLWPLGRLAHTLEPVVDIPVFHWFEVGQLASWSRVWRVLTNIGSLELTQSLTVLGAVSLALLWKRRRWWVPPLTLCVGYLMEKYWQEALRLVVDRGHPPTTLGTWPSGGCARVILVYGLIVYFILRWKDPRSIRPWVVSWSLVALAATVQAYARTYNLEHWFTDVLGGLVFGVMLLSTMISAAWVLDRGSRPEPGTTEKDPHSLVSRI